ncbi:hypothetical protein BDQ17DRAFT_141525 [Cyathus striatus]|nr:hypothetical protein BDQ17DRAFT_141525 [Cyathus striatus]
MSTTMSLMSNDSRESFQSVYFSSFAATGLWGILTMQVYLYYLKYPKDRLWIKLMAFWLWLIATIHQALYIYGCELVVRQPLGSSGSNCVFTVSRLVVSENNTGWKAEWDNPKEFVWQKILIAFASTTMQGFFIYRLYIFNGGRKICLVILVPSTLMQLACNIAYSVATMEHSKNSVYIKLGLISSAFAVFVDLLTSGCMAYWLFTGRTGTKRTDRIISHLFTIAIASGLWTSGLAIGTLVTILKARNPYLKMALQIPLVSGYGNVVLANLNVRSYIRNEGKIHPPGDMPDCTDSFDSSKVCRHF